jgi:phosphatidylglycerol:prolipoprotein diacylglycerol transferase
MLPVLTFGPFAIHMYSVCMVTAVTLGGWLTYREARRRNRLTDSTLTVGVMGLLGGVIGAKLIMIVFLGPSDFWRLLPTLPFQGLAFTGAMIGGYIAVVITERILKVQRCTGDLVAPFIPLSQAIGRLGNFLAGDAYGLETTLPWGVTMAGAQRHPVWFREQKPGDLLRRRGNRCDASWQ